MLFNPVRWLLAAALTATYATAAAAPAASARTEQVEVRLVSDVATVSPGQTIHLGLEQKIIPHWHTYWKNPGDSGTSTSIEWTLPAGVVAGDIIWPAPSRFTIGPITNYGYATHVVLLSKLTVPASQPVGSRIPVVAKASWLVCEESCIPQDATLQLDLEVAQAPVASGGEQQQLIQAALKQVPPAVNWPAVYERQQGKLIARLTLPAELDGKPVAALLDNRELTFYPAQWGTIAHNAAQTFTLQDGRLTIALTPGETPPAAGSPVRGVLGIAEKGGSAGHSHTVQAFELGTAAAAGEAQHPDEASITLWRALLLAFAGGVVLNLMPCVFPVLSIKALGLLKHSELSTAQKRLQGIAYTLGVLASFSLLALGLIVLKNLGAQVGWGFQFQSPYFVLGVAYLIFVVGLSLSGVFALGGPANLGSQLAARPGYSGSFFTGVLATIVATPCTAPFMGAALGFALTQPSFLLWLIFIALGLGLAVPYLLISAWPALHALLPKPGLWMERLKQALAFPMYAAAAWLVWVLAQQAGVNAVPLALGGMIVLALIAWLFDSTRATSGKARLLANGVVLAGTLATVGVSFEAVRFVGAGTSQVAQAKEDSAWEAYSPSRLADLRQQGKPVFINLTAAWCITCLVNERVALSQPAFKDLLQKEGITYLKGDWTNQDAQISALLKQYGRSGVPLYLFYPSGVATKAVVLPQILTHEIVSSALQAK